MAFVVVTYRYSMSSDRALTEAATWAGRVPGLSLATVMSELRRMHRCATNISVTEVEWRDDRGEGGGTREPGGDPGGLQACPPRSALM